MDCKAQVSFEYLIIVTFAVILTIAVAVLLTIFNGMSLDAQAEILKVRENTISSVMG